MAACQAAPGAMATVMRGVEFSTAHPPPRSTMTVKRSGFRRGEGLAMRRSRALPFAIVLEGGVSPSLRRGSAWIVRLSNGVACDWPRAAPAAHNIALPFLQQARDGQAPKGTGSRRQGDNGRAKPRDAANQINNVKQQKRPHNSNPPRGVNNFFAVNDFKCLEAMRWCNSLRLQRKTRRDLPMVSMGCK